MLENRNGVVYKDCFICGKQYPENLVEHDYMAAIGDITLCVSCYDKVWDKDDAKGYSLKKETGLVETVSRIQRC